MYREQFVPTIGYVRDLSIRSLCVYCRGKREGAWPCHHSGVVGIAEMSSEITLASIELKLVCKACGAIGAADARPDWSELHAIPAAPRPQWLSPPRVAR